jgi:hypothetical protein
MNGYAEETVLRFGRYKGKRLSEIPTSYLEWCLANVELKYGLDADIRHELRARGVRHEFEDMPKIKPPRGLQYELALKIVESGRRQMALKYHPDRENGDTRAMSDVNACADALSELLGQLEART